MSNNSKLLQLNVFSLKTEIWDYENESVELIEPTLSNDHYVWGMALYPVDDHFCVEN